jgi:hypothetical protein
MSDSSIHPGVGIGAYRLGLTELEVLGSCGHPHRVWGRGGLRFLGYQGITVTVHEGVVNMVIAETPEAAITASGVNVGTSFVRLVSDGPLQYDEEQALWFRASEPGVWYEIARPPSPGETPIDPPLVPELYGVTMPTQAVVQRIYVMHPTQANVEVRA